MAKFEFMESPHELKSWIGANTTQARFAREVGCSEAYLCEILKGRKQPSMGLAAKMSAATSYAVPLSAFVRSPRLQPEERVAE